MLEIRAMQAEDLEAVVRTESQIFSRPWSRKGFEDALRQKETIYLVAYEKDILAGYCGLLQSFDEADITNVAVVEKFRKKGAQHDAEAADLEMRQHMRISKNDTREAARSAGMDAQF